MRFPRLTIDLDRLEDNARQVSQWYRARGVRPIVVSKAILGCPEIVNRWLSTGVDTVADSRVENIRRMKNAGVDATFVLLRTPLSQVTDVVKTVDISHASDLTLMEAIGQASRNLGKKHKVIIVVETGDMRDGVLPSEFQSFFVRASKIEGIQIKGVSTNMGCVSGDPPTENQIQTLCELVSKTEAVYGHQMEIVSGGSSSAHDWIMSQKNCSPFNEARIGELILLGREPLSQRSVDGLSTAGFRLFAEVIEERVKPTGEQVLSTKLDAKKSTRRAVLALGRQDVDLDGLKPNGPFEVVGGSSDHVVLDSSPSPLKVGDVVEFRLNYPALVAAMTCPFVQKEFVGSGEIAQLTNLIERPEPTRPFKIDAPHVLNESVRQTKSDSQ